MADSLSNRYKAWHRNTWVVWSTVALWTWRAAGEEEKEEEGGEEDQEEGVEAQDRLGDQELNVELIFKVVIGLIIIRLIKRKRLQCCE